MSLRRCRFILQRSGFLRAKVTTSLSSLRRTKRPSGRSEREFRRFCTGPARIAAPPACQRLHAGTMRTGPCKYNTAVRTWPYLLSGNCPGVFRRSGVQGIFRGFPRLKDKKIHFFGPKIWRFIFFAYLCTTLIEKPRAVSERKVSAQTNRGGQQRPRISITADGAIAQLVEQRTENPCVPGSIPGGTTENQRVTKVTLFLF